MHQTSFGPATNRPTGENSFIKSDAGLGKVGGFILTDSAGVLHYLWCDTTGDLRISTTEPSNPQSDGTVVGSQS